MQCPVDGTLLQLTERQGVEIDDCPKCRGVWLDRRELDKIIDRSTPAVALEPPGDGDLRADLRDSRDDPRRRRSRDEGDDAPAKPRRKRRSLLSGIFDFD